MNSNPRPRGLGWIRRFSVLLLALLAAPGRSHALQDEVGSRIPQSKQAMLVIEAAPERIFKNPLVAPLLGTSDLRRWGPPIELEDYRSIRKVSFLMGALDMRTGQAEFVARVWVKDQAKLPELTAKMFLFGGERLETMEEDGWTVCKSRMGWPAVIRYRDDLLEFGTSLYAYSPSDSVMAPSLNSAFGGLNQQAAFRMSVDAEVLAKLFDRLLKQENAAEEAVYEMIRWGRWVNEGSLAIYGVSLLKELNTASLTVDLDSDVIAQLKLVPREEKAELVRARVRVLHDFILFHFQLPIEILREKKNPVADVLEKIAAGLKLSVDSPEIQLTFNRPEGLEETTASILEKFKNSFAEKEDENKMKMLGLAAHNYHDTFRKFPVASDPDEDRRFSPDLSWRVKLLPYLEQINAYDQMDLKQPWDAKVNQAAIPAGRSSFVLSNGALVCGIKTDPPVKSFGTILDGTSNTIMFMENRNASMTPWSKPLDFTIDEAVQAVAKLKRGEFLWVTFYDGSVHRLPSLDELEMTEMELKNVFDPRDGNVTSIHEQLQNSRSTLFPEIRRPRRFDEGKIEAPIELRMIEEAEEVPDVPLPRLAPKGKVK